MGSETDIETDGERTPLIGSNSKSVKFEGNTENDPSESQIRRIPPKRPVVVEPVLVIYVLSAYIMGQCSALYIYDKLLDGALKKAGLNLTAIPGAASEGCGGNKTEMSDIVSGVQSEASTLTGILMLVTGIPAIFVSIFLGSFSDTAGRRWAIIPPLIGGVLKALCYILVIVLDLPAWWLVLGSFVDGCGGYLVTLMMGCSAYIVDSTSRENRIIRLALAELCSMASIVVAPIGLGYWIQTGGYLWPFVTVTGIFTVNLIYVFFFVPETIMRDTDDPRPAFFTLDPLRKVKAMYSESMNSREKWKLVALSVAFFFASISVMNFAVDTLFIKNTPLCWDSVTIGYYLATYVGVSGVCGFINAKLMKRCMTDEMIAFVVALAGCCLQIYKSVVVNTLMMFFTAAFGAFAFLTLPSIRAIMSKLIKESEQGLLFGIIAMIEMFALSVGGFAINSIYAATQDISSGLVFIVVALLMMIVVFILGVYMCKSGKRKQLLRRRNMTDAFAKQLFGKHRGDSSHDKKTLSNNNLS